MKKLMTLLLFLIVPVLGQYKGWDGSDWLVPATGKVYFDLKGDTYAYERAADTLEVYVGGVAFLKLEEGAADRILSGVDVLPATNVTYDLGASALKWDSLFVGDIDADELSVDTLTINVLVRPDASQGADIGTSALPFNLVWGDSVHANWFGGTNFELGQSGDVITVDATTFLFNGTTAAWDSGGTDATILFSQANTRFDFGNYGISIPAGKTYMVNGVQISSANLSDEASIFMLDENETVTGAPIFSNATTAITVGAAGVGVDYRILFDGETADGTITYMEDEDRFDFDNAVDVIGALTASTVASDGTISGTAITGTSFVIGANTLTTSEWAFLDGIDQTVATTSSPTFVALTLSSDITTTAAAIDWDLIDNNASALSWDAVGKAGILEIVTTNGSEGVKMSGSLTVSGSVSMPWRTQAFVTQTSVGVKHSLGYKPFAWVEDGSGDNVVGEINHVSTDSLTVTFGVSQTGTVHYR